MNELLSIKFIGPTGGHKDIVVIVKKNGFRGIFDSYYFVDDEIKTNLKGMEKIKLVLTRLILYWIKNIIESSDGQVLYLPIDFSDQYIGCFRVKKEQKNLFISYGYTFIEGFSVSPSEPGTFSNTVDDFEKEDRFVSFTVSQDEFIKALNENVKAIRKWRCF